ncbi:SOS response-associated peptidase [Alicyclobacillus fodiniaquatilis]|uniref:Abasic site processing protein n=1 Tax=Alicyclobacillus fodiniaquatilis TaxID=1661150 RepID=A0ABW4JFA7_9BACL
MCGRFAFASDMTELLQYYGLTESSYEMPTRYNIAPSQSVAAVIADDNNQLRVGPLKWGLMPRVWGADTKTKPINARAEGLPTNRTFKPLLTRKRCLIPSTGYYEWRPSDKQPFYIHVESQPIFSFAGIYDTLESENGEKVSTFAIITCPPNDRTEKIHNRMPVILPREQVMTWLDRGLTDVELLTDMLRPYPSDDTEFYAVSKLVGNVRNDSSKCVQPI